MPERDHVSPHGTEERKVTPCGISTGPRAWLGSCTDTAGSDPRGKSREPAPDVGLLPLWFKAPEPHSSPQGGPHGLPATLQAGSTLLTRPHSYANLDP